MQFDWDPEKARTNLAKHGVSFEQATKAFDDPNAIEFDDDHPDEVRVRLIGYSGADLLLLVVYTEREGSKGELVMRIISTRRVTSHERLQYEEG